MKKFVFLSLAAALLTVSSCQSYNCYCDNGTTAYTVTVKATSSSSAISKCAAKSNATQTCSL